MSTIEEANRCVEALNEKEIYNQKIKVEISKKTKISRGGVGINPQDDRKKDYHSYNIPPYHYQHPGGYHGYQDHHKPFPKKYEKPASGK